MSSNSSHERAPLTYFTEPQKRVPHERIQFQRLNPTIHGLVKILMSLPEFAFETINRCCIWQVLSPGFAVLICMDVMISACCEGTSTTGITTYSMCFGSATLLCFCLRL